MVRAAEDEVKTLADELKERSFGDDLHVLSVQVEAGTDEEGDPAAWLTVIATDPANETWNLDSVLALRRHVANVMAHGEYGTTVYLRLMPVSDQGQEEDAADPPRLF